ncbi:MAG: hypothetical protein JWM99_3070 [Verrucomicrobiales bacterium]|nr:hypothetical protein [Verrucomicrobiales bacterium]
MDVGAASIDITPDYPIRLSGYGSRKTESEGIAQRLHASAMAIGNDAQGPALLVSVDNCGLPLTLREEVGRRLGKHSIRDERINLCSTHTHCAPCLTGVLPNLFSSPIIASEQKTIDRYTAELTDKIEQVCLQALQHRQPSQLRFGQGSVDFAQNRRTKGGPVDHTLNLLVAFGTNNTAQALFANYACHCTTLGGEFNKVHGDWAGVAREAIEQETPNTIAIISLGCGGDANPQPRGTVELVNQHGHEFAAEVKQILSHLTPIGASFTSAAKALDLPFDPLPTRQQWEERAKKSGIVAYHARLNLERIDRGETLPKSIPYPIQTLSFGTNLTMVFLPGEVVIDYDLELKKVFDPKRVCVIGYANYVPCYIPSRRILEEGGYEAEDSLWYYDRPARLSPSIEQTIVNTAQTLPPAGFKISDR